VPVTPETKAWLKYIWPLADGIGFFKKRIRFIDFHTKVECKAVIPKPMAVVYWAGNASAEGYDRFEAAFAETCNVVPVGPTRERVKERLIALLQQNAGLLSRAESLETEKILALETKVQAIDTRNASILVLEGEGVRDIDVATMARLRQRLITNKVIPEGNPDSAPARHHARGRDGTPAHHRQADANSATRPAESTRPNDEVPVRARDGRPGLAHERWRASDPDGRPSPFFPFSSPAASAGSPSESLNVQITLQDLTVGQRTALETVRKMASVPRGGIPETCVIAGPAGTGKTTLLRMICDEIGDSLIVAPTGKAALRVKQATGYTATTIHKLLFKAVKSPVTGEMQFTLKEPHEITAPEERIPHQRRGVDDRRVSFTTR
jgi:hypothetical protein